MTPEDKEGEDQKEVELKRQASVWVSENMYSPEWNQEHDDCVEAWLAGFHAGLEGCLAGRASRDGEIESLRRDEHSAAQRANRLGDQLARVRGVLTLIAAPKRPDGTYNRCREACEELAREALKGIP